MPDAAGWRVGLPSEPCVCDVMHLATGATHQSVRVEWTTIQGRDVLAARLARGVHLYGDGHVLWRLIEVPAGL